MHFRWFKPLAVVGGLLPRALAQGPGINLDLTSDDSIKAAAKKTAYNLMTYYTGNQTGQVPGLLPQPYYWWEAGAMFGQLIHYWHLTGDTTYNEVVKQALLFQIGDDKNYMPQNQTKDLGNDDQTFWAFSAMDAAELGFENPDSSQPTWVALAQAVFNTQVPQRWDMTTCGGGLRWQIYPFNAGYQYKNTISTGGLFQLTARLARYTGNQTYADWAEKTWDWVYQSPIMGGNLNQVWDGTYMTDNCTGATKTYWTYNVGTMMMGAAYMANMTSDQKWIDRVTGLMNATNVFFVQTAGANSPPATPQPNGEIMCEVACETPATQTCNYDQPSFKAYLSRWLAVTGQLVPQVAPQIAKRLQASATAAAVQCSGQNKNMCGRRWYQNTWDGMFGVGEQMSAMSVFQNNLIKNVAGPVTLKQGGSSQSDPSAGLGTGNNNNPAVNSPALTNTITTGDKAGAGILTLISVVLVLGGTSWMVI